MDRKQESSSLSHHILPTCANLLGICFIIFGLVHKEKNADSTLLDECAALAMLVFLAASFFSYLSLRSPNRRRLARMADIAFLTGLCILTTAAVLITLKFIR